jgi:hypothetical protein
MLNPNMAAAQVASNPDFMFHFGTGKSDPEIKAGLFRLNEEFRRIFYQNHAHNRADIYGGLYRKANSPKEAEQNNAEILKIANQRVLESRADADAGVIFARQLEQIDPRRFMVKYRPRGMWREFLPDVDVQRGLKNITYRVEDFRAQVEPITVGTVADIPYVGISTEEFSNQVVTKGLGYKYTVDELDAAAFAGVPLQDRYQSAVLKGYEENQDNVAFYGDTERELEGIINHTGVTNNQAAAPASGTDKKWSGTDKTNDEKLADIRGMVTTISTQSEENYNGDRTQFVLLVPRVPYDALNVRMAAGTDTTLLEFILRQQKYGIVDIKVLPQLAGQGTGGTDLAIMLPFMDREVIEFHVSSAVLWEPAQFHGLDIRFPSRNRHGGVVIRYPIAMTQLYGI